MKQSSQMNQSICYYCYDINQITKWHHLIEIRLFGVTYKMTDNEEINIEIREQEQNIKQIFLRSLVSNLLMKVILKI
ncbi:hypothetical protein RhiirB3_453868 [Rhizophagus irregularis]|nr:hypothetical protein RhiirB3_453868 [Rhizophagus irregularis]